jgi:hypothetical protein
MGWYTKYLQVALGSSYDHMYHIPTLAKQFNFVSWLCQMFMLEMSSLTRCFFCFYRDTHLNWMQRMDVTNDQKMALINN